MEKKTKEEINAVFYVWDKMWKRIRAFFGWVWPVILVGGAIGGIIFWFQACEAQEAEELAARPKQCADWAAVYGQPFKWYSKIGACRATINGEVYSVTLFTDHVNKPGEVWKQACQPGWEKVMLPKVGEADASVP